MNSPSPDQRTYWAVAAAVHVAVTGAIDEVDGGDDAVSAVTDEAALREYVESYLDGYEVTQESLDSAVREGTALTAATLKELISQATAAGMDVEEFFADGDVDIEAGVAAAASFAAGSTVGEPSVRDQVFSVFRQAAEQGECVFVEPTEVHMSRLVWEVAQARIDRLDLPEDSEYFGWGRGGDTLRPDGTFKRGEDHLTVYWGGHAQAVLDVLRRVEHLGFVVEGGLNGRPFRLVSADSASSAEPYLVPERADLLTDLAGGGDEPLVHARTWVEKTHSPRSAEDLLTESEARELYDSDTASELFIFPEVSAGSIPGWVISVRTGKKSVTVSHFHRPSGSLARTIEFAYNSSPPGEHGRGSLHRRSVSDYLWPADHSTYAPKARAASVVTLKDARPISQLVRHDRAMGTKSVSRHRDFPGERSVGHPVFGEWRPILDPMFGQPQASDLALRDTTLVSRAERAALAERLEAVAASATAADLETFLDDDRDEVRTAAASGAVADAQLLHTFSTDPWWRVREAVATHPQVSRETLMAMLEAEPRKDSAVGRIVERRLERW